MPAHANAHAHAHRIAPMRRDNEHDEHAQDRLRPVAM
jgi:hypothetical protein